MARKKYIAFIDEVKPTNPFYYYNYTCAIIEQSEYNKFAIEFDNVKDNCLKRLGGKSINLHYYDLTKKKGDFSRLILREEQEIWKELFDLFNRTKFHVLSGVVDINRYTKYCQQFKINIEPLAFRLLLQNIVRFLYIENGFADMVIESSNDERKLLEEYFRLKIAGSEFITSEAYKQFINNFTFESKGKLVPGLQLADFIANPVSRMLCNLNQFKISSIDKNAYFDLLQRKIYEGNHHIMFEFGVKKWC